MKKTSINLLCILIICILSVSVLLPAYYLGARFTEGFVMGYEMAGTEAEVKTEVSALDVYFEPSSELVIFPKDSITFDDGRRLPVVVKQASVIVDRKCLSSAPIWISGGCTVLSLVCFVLLLVEFVKFIVNINRGQIFVEANVKRLRRFSYCLITIALLGIISGVSQESLVSSMGLTLEGYKVSAYWVLPLGNLLFGLLALLVAQVWSQGIMLEEELRLTV